MRGPGRGTRWISLWLIGVLLSPGLPVQVARADAPPAVQTVRPPDAAGTGFPENASASVFLVETEGWTGTGFLIDPSGLILTSSIRPESERHFTVQIAPGRKVRALKVATRASVGLNMIKVHPETVTGLRTLSFIGSTPGAGAPATGDRLAALVGSSDGQAVVRTCTIVKVKKGSLATDLPTALNMKGAPLFDTRGQLVGWFPTDHPRKAGLVAAKGLTAAPFIAEGMSVAAAIPPPLSTPYPAAPERPFPAEGLSKVATAGLELGAYQIVSERYLVTLLTPPLMAALTARAIRVNEKDDGAWAPPPGPMPQPGRESPCREAKGPTNRWSPMLHDDAPVVTVQVIPEIHRQAGTYAGVAAYWIFIPFIELALLFSGGRPAGVGIPHPYSRFEPEIDEIRLLRGGEEMLPIKIEETCSPDYGSIPVEFCPSDSSRSDRRRVKGCYLQNTFPIEAFAPGEAVELRMVRKRGDGDPNPVIVGLSPEMQARVWNDFASYRASPDH